MYINAVANSVMLQLQLQHDFYNIIFKSKHKLHTALGSAPAPPIKILGAYLNNNILTTMKKGYIKCNLYLFMQTEYSVKCCYW
jgi:hypothetical protein